MAHNQYTINGFVASTPQFTATSSSTGVTKFRLAASRNVRDDNGGWKSLDEFWTTVEAWGRLGYNVRRSLRKGMPVIVTGYPTTHTYTTKEGATSTAVVLKARFIGPDLGRMVVDCHSDGGAESETTIVGMQPEFVDVYASSHPEGTSDLGGGAMAA